MNTPITLFASKLPTDILNIIQKYIRNDLAHEAVSNYIWYLKYEQNLYDTFVYYTYIEPTCYCDQLSRRYILKYDGCDHCRLYENTQHYMISQYLTCVYDNDNSIVYDTE